jgi:hypothetical protein
MPQPEEADSYQRNEKTECAKKRNSPTVRT